MNETGETVREVCAEMREHSSGDVSETYYDRYAWEVLINRILAAHERELAAKDAEIARLKAALKPMMEVHLNDGGTTPLSDSICAVAEAQRIMKEEGAK